MESLALRPYQERATTRALRMFAKHRAVLLESPVGSGKTVMAMAIAAALQRRTLLVSHRRELNDQMMDTARALGVHAEKLTIQGYAHAGGDTRNDTIRGFGFVVVDECHRSQAPYYRKLLAHIDPNAMVLGTTATPARLDGQSLFDHAGGFFRGHVVASTAQQLVDEGYILNPRVYTCHNPIDIRTLKDGAHDFSQEALEAATRTKYFNGGVVENWRAKADGKSTLVFAVSREHGRELAIRFREAGVSVAYVDGYTPNYLRDRVLDGFKNRKYTVLINVHVCSEGWDWPGLECVVLATATRSTGLYRQMVGRVMRNDFGKTRPIVLDHGRNVFLHGMPTDDWPGPNAGIRIENIVTTKTCPECMTVVSLKSHVCECGHDFRKDKKWMMGYEEVPVELAEVNDLARRFNIDVDATTQCYLPAETDTHKGRHRLMREGQLISLRKAICDDMGVDTGGEYRLVNFCHNPKSCVNPEHISNIGTFEQTMPRIVAYWSKRNLLCLEWMRSPRASSDQVSCGFANVPHPRDGRRAKSMTPVSYMRSLFPDIKMTRNPICDNERCIRPEHYVDTRGALRRAISKKVRREGECDTWIPRVHNFSITLCVTGISKHTNAQGYFNVKTEILRQTGFSLPDNCRVLRTCSNILCVRGSHLAYRATNGALLQGVDL